MAGIVDEMVKRVPSPGLLQRLAQPVGESLECACVGGVELEGHGLAPQRLDFRHHGFSSVAAAVIGQHDIAALAGDADGGIAAQAAACSGNKCDLCHGSSPVVRRPSYCARPAAAVAGNLTFFA
ncbi:hypothetical protein D3C87_1873910 [compost metagenome]